MTIIVNIIISALSTNSANQYTHVPASINLVPLALASCTALSVVMQDQEKGHLHQLQSLMPTYRARPSLLGPLAAAAGFSLGAAAGVLPTKFAHAITGDPHARNPL